MEWWDEENCLLKFIKSNFYMTSDPLKGMTNKDVLDKLDDIDYIKELADDLGKYLEMF